MSEIMQLVEATFKPGVLVFVLANMFTLGLQARMGDVIDTFKNKKAMALIFVWGFVLGPALAYLITLVISLAQPYVIVMLISSVAPMAPFFPLAVEKARGDVIFANAFVPVVIVGTVVFMPLIGPLVIEGMTVSPLALASRLFLTLLLPLAIGITIRHYAETVATRIFPAVSVFTKIITAVMIIECVLIYGPPLSIRFRPETESAKRHGAGYAAAQYGRHFGCSFCHSGPGSGRHNLHHHVGCDDASTLTHCSQNIRQARRKTGCRKYDMSAAHKLKVSRL
jgi:hypothetical protein